MVQFRNVVGAAGMTGWRSDGNDLIAFGRGAFVLFVVGLVKGGLMIVSFGI